MPPRFRTYTHTVESSDVAHGFTVTVYSDSADNDQWTVCYTRAGYQEQTIDTFRTNPHPPKRVIAEAVRKIVRDYAMRIHNHASQIRLKGVSDD